MTILDCSFALSACSFCPQSRRCQRIKDYLVIYIRRKREQCLDFHRATLGLSILNSLLQMAKAGSPFTGTFAAAPSLPWPPLAESHIHQIHSESRLGNHRHRHLCDPIRGAYMVHQGEREPDLPIPDGARLRNGSRRLCLPIAVKSQSFLCQFIHNSGELLSLHFPAGQTVILDCPRSTFLSSSAP